MLFCFPGDLDCTPPSDALCSDVEDQPPYPDGYITYHMYPCKLVLIEIETTSELICFYLC